ncbi:MAG: nucleotidyl transferase AbiEii/AbiGii toxin family protein [Myxococcota bacterium]
MKRAYATPLAFKEALEARLRERAALEGRAINRVRQLLVMERYLARVFACVDSAVLKGGIVMELRLDRARATKDVDLRLVGRPEELLTRLQAAGRLDLGDHLSFEVRADPTHPVIEADGLRYDGQRFRAEARLAGRPYGSVFGVDVAVGEPLVGRPQEIEGSEVLAFIGVPAPRFLAYPIATHIAEKLHAYTLPRPRPNSRVKDLPDIALLAQAGAVAGPVLSEAIASTFANRATHPVPALLPDPPEGWVPVYARMAAEEGLPWSDLPDLVSAVRAFLDPVLAGQPRAWNPARWRWEDRER